MANGIRVVQLPSTSPTPVVVRAGASPLQGARVVRISHDGPGGSGSYDPARTFVQTMPQSVVTINHGLGYRPGGVSLFSYPSADTQYEGYSVEHLTENSIRIAMDAPTAFIAYMS